MAETTSESVDVLNSAGKFLLSFDTRLVIVIALGIFSVIYFAKKLRKNTMPQAESVRLALGLLQIYTALGVLSVFVLTKPPAIELMSDFQRQTCGLIVVVFLIARVIQEIEKFWDG